MIGYWVTECMAVCLAYFINQIDALWVVIAAYHVVHL